MVTDDGETVAFDVSALDSETVTPPAGAAEASVTLSVADWPIDVVTVPGTRIEPADCTVTAAVPLAMLAEPLLAVMVVEPKPVGVISTFMLVTPVAKLTEAGTVATPVLLDVRVNVRPP